MAGTVDIGTGRCVRCVLAAFAVSLIPLLLLLLPCFAAGTVSGVQASIQSFFEILSFVAGCVVNKPEHFHWLMSGSCCAVASAAALYAAFAARDRISSGACELGAAAP